MAYDIHSLFDFSGGMVTRYVNPANAPKNILTAGENVELTELALRTRKGYSEWAKPWDSTMEVVSLYGANFTKRGLRYIVAQVSASGGKDFGLLSSGVMDINDIGLLTEEVTNYISASVGSYLFAGRDHGTDQDINFKYLYDLGATESIISQTTLNDRLVLTEGTVNSPLVFSGCLTTDGSDWAIPKTVLGTYDGTNFFDMTSELCDPDVSTVFNLGRFSTDSAIYICCDTPNVNGVYLGITSGNIIEAALSIKGFRGGSWVNLSFNDGTSLNNIPLKQSGPITFDIEGLTQSNIVGVSGFWIKISLSFAPEILWWSNVEIETGDTTFLDLKGTIASWEANISSRYSGRFLASGGGVVTIGSGHTVPDVVEGCRVVFSSGEATILHISNGGAGTADVMLSEIISSQSVTGIYAGLYQDGALTVNTDMGWKGETNTETSGIDGMDGVEERYSLDSKTLSCQPELLDEWLDVPSPIKYWVQVWENTGAFCSDKNGFGNIFPTGVEPTVPQWSPTTTYVQGMKCKPTYPHGAYFTVTGGQTVQGTFTRQTGSSPYIGNNGVISSLSASSIIISYAVNGVIQTLFSFDVYSGITDDGTTNK